MSETNIVPTVIDHIERISAIEKMCFSTPWSKDSFLYSLNNPNTQSCFSAVLNDSVVGYICFFHLYEHGELLNIAVHPNFRKSGIAQLLVDTMFDIMKQKNVQKITLEVRKSNVPAILLYEKNGFSPISVRKNYYTHPFEDAIVMQKLI